MSASQRLRTFTGNPIFVGWCIGIAFALVCTISAVSYTHEARADLAAAADLVNQHLVASQEAGVLHQVRDRARELMPSLTALCTAGPPAVQALLVVTGGAPGLQLRVTSTDTPPKAEVGEQTGALLASASGSEADLVRWLVRIDNDPDLRDSVALKSIDRPAQSQDAHIPASASRVSASIRIDAYELDAKICQEVRYVAER